MKDLIYVLAQTPTPTPEQPPYLFYASIIATAFAFVGVFVSNWSNSVRQKASLAHDAAEKAKQRAFDFRKETAMETWKALGWMKATWMNPPESLDIYDEIQKKMEDIFRSLQMAVTETTAFKAFILEQLCFHANANIMDAAGSAAMLSAEKSQRYKHTQDSMAAVNRVIDEIYAFNESGVVNPARLKALNESHQKLTQLHTEQQQQWQEVIPKHSEATKKYLYIASDYLDMLAPFMTEIYIEMRKDMGIDDHRNLYAIKFKAEMLKAVELFDSYPEFKEIVMLRNMTSQPK